MQAIFETIFDIGYLIAIAILGIKMLKGSEKHSVTWLFGIMTIILVGGDAFHLIPRVYSFWTNGLEANIAMLGIGKLITSITMTIFYVVLYYIWRKWYNIGGKSGLTITLLILAVVRIALCLFPQNQWMSIDAPAIWGIYRNIPFVIMGIIMIIQFFLQANKSENRVFKYMWIAITLSFVFYIPVILFVKTIPIIGMLMIPKTLAYVWMVVMGYNTLKEGRVVKA